MKLSKKAIQDLRIALVRSYGTDFGLDDEALCEIGMLLLTVMAESLKLKAGVLK
jgi:hypothetical protein